jgi:hypothetical protein
MSDVISDPETAPVGSPPIAQINLAELDDKHLGQYRHPNERRALVAIAIGLAAILFALWVARPIFGNFLAFLPGPILGFLATWLHPTRLGLVLLIVLALTAVFDAIGQWTRAWQLVAQAVEVTPTTFPELAPIVDELRSRFDLPRTRVYVSRDAPPNGYTIGVREPFAIVFSSVGVGSLTPEEFKFSLGREMGSIKLGHTRMATLLGNVNMSLPQPMSFLLKFRSVIFGTYHHAQALSCDRIGVVATRDVRPALSTLVKQNLGTVRGAKIDVTSLTPQTAALQRGASGAVLRTAMVFNPQPFAVARLAELVAWTGEPAPAVTTAPAAPPPPTPAASAAAAAKSAAEAAASAAAAAASAAEVAAAAALLAPTPEDAGDPLISTESEVADEPASGATIDGSSQASDAPSPSAAPNAPTTPTPASLAAANAAPTAPVTPAEGPPATETVAAPAPASESTGTGAPTQPPAAPEGGSVSVTGPQPPQRQERDQGGTR